MGKALRNEASSGRRTPAGYHGAMLRNRTPENPSPALATSLSATLLVSAWILTGCAAPSVRETPQTTLESEESVKPGINESWKSDEIEPLIGRLETESREIFIRRELLANVVGPPRGSVIADVGAGSGFMTRLFADRVGPEGRVFAVDINPTMLEHVASDAQAAGFDNVETVVCTERSVELADSSVDLVFLCDTYHHFEYPRNSLASIHSALRPGGQLILIDFHRVPGVTRDWLLDHVRAGEEVFRSEVEAAGFELIADHELAELEENYMLRFLKR